MAIVFLIGRVIFSLFWLKSAYRHLTHASALAGYAGSKKIPAPKLAVIISGILLLVGGLSMLLGYWPHIGLIAIAIFLICVTPTMHAFWKEQDPNMRMADNIQFWKNVTLLGAVLMMFMIPFWPYSL